MSDAPCQICNQYDDKKVKSNNVNWIICSHCDRPYHTSCVRINSLEYRELSQEWSLWYCPKCRNEGPNGDLHVKINEMQSQLNRMERASTADVNAADLIAPAVNQILPSILERIETTVMSSFDTKIEACVSKIEGDFTLFKSNIDSRIADLVEASVRKHMDTISDAGADSNRRLECEIDRSVAIKVGAALDDRIGKLRTELSKDLKPTPASDLSANNSKLDAVSDKIERQNRASHLVLRNLPSKDETAKTDLRAVIAHIGAKTSYTFSPSDIRMATRFTSTKQRICPIVIKFKTNDVRDSFYEHYFKNLKQFTLASLGFGDAHSRIYINEHLTERNMQLFNSANQLKREPGSRIKKVSTRNGLVYVTAIDETRGQLISSPDDLRRFSTATHLVPVAPNPGPPNVLAAVDAGVTAGTVSQSTEMHQRWSDSAQ